MQEDKKRIDSEQQVTESTESTESTELTESTESGGVSEEMMVNEAGSSMKDPDTKDSDTEDSKKPVRKHRVRKVLLTLVLILVCFGAGTAFGSVVLPSLTASALGLDTAGINKKLLLLNACIQQYFLDDYDEEKLTEGAYSGFMNALGDPYSCYYSATEYKQLQEEDSGEYRGIGVTVSKNEDNNYAEVMSIFKDTPAYNAGIKNGDYIVEVNGKDTSTMTLTEVVTEIKSSEDPVILQIYRDGEELEISVEKDTISVESVSYEMKDDKIAYVSISQFLENTDEQFTAAIDELEAEGMKGLIIDLRDNGGGMLDSCVNMLSRILPKDKLIVYTQDKNENRQDYLSNSDATLDLPIVLLVNENTASASEIMTGCLKDYGLATVIGTTTYGKGIVQSILPLSDGSAIKLTISAYYTPNGVNIHKKGIEPDETMEMTDEEWKAAQEDPSTDAQIKRAMEILK